jgi:hypothetical protein
MEMKRDGITSLSHPHPNPPPSRGRDFFHFNRFTLSPGGEGRVRE